jgi:5-oxopent-3-ene-1,2,5-tricarboxylate decarboxylase/2-hydroxyhepta-2,4-diene-1,7-dioate isomerase
VIYGVILNDVASLKAFGSLDGAPYKGAPQAPVLYIKPPNTVVGDGAVVTLPQGAALVEIGAVVGVVFNREVGLIEPQAVADVIAGYVVAADLSLPHASYYRPAIREKCFDGACPISAQPVPLEQVGALGEVNIHTYIDGQPVNSRSLAGLVRDVAQLVSQISNYMTFRKGDVLLTGVAWQAPRVGVGSKIRVQADRIGSIEFSIAAQPRQRLQPAVPLAYTRTKAPAQVGRIAWEGAIREVTPAQNGQVRLSDGRTIDEGAGVWLPPIDVGTIFALGLNYANHAKELAFKAPENPLVFLKGPNALTGHRSLSRRPISAAYMHYECELAVVIGKSAFKVSKESAMDYVAGYTIANDYAIRDYLENYYRPNLRVKNRDNCTPIGPWLTARDAVADPMALRLTTRINGRVTQTGSTADMIFDIPTLIEYLSSFMTLAPGDVILTGTPEGLADVKIGDTVETEIEGLGCLVNTMAAHNASF